MVHELFGVFNNRFSDQIAPLRSLTISRADPDITNLYRRYLDHGDEIRCRAKAYLDSAVAENQRIA